MPRFETGRHLLTSGIERELLSRNRGTERDYG
jgi:hypothetical protein